MRKIILSIIFLMVLLLAGCVQNLPQQQNVGLGNNLNLAAGNVSTTQDLKKFDNVDELKAFLAQNGGSGSNTAQTFRSSSGLAKGGVMMAESAVATADMSAAVPAPSGGSASTTDYSHTNIQVTSVDEADFVKNDGQYIYILSNNKLVIVDAFDAKNAKIVSTTEVPKNNNSYWDNAREIFVNGDKLILFVDSSEKSFYFQKYDINPIENYRSMLKAYVYDISDRSSPKLLKDFSITGSYFQSRMIGDVVYVVTQDGVNYGGVYINEPMVKEASGSVIRPSIYYFDNPDENYQFNTITSLSLSSDDVVDSKSFMLGYSNTLMVSEKNIYIAYQKQQYWWGPWYYPYRNTYDKDRFYNVIMPLLEGQLKTDVETITQKGLKDDEEWKQISVVLSDFFTKVNSDETFKNQYDSMFTKISDAVQEYDLKKSMEQSKTVIQKIAIDNGKIEYKAKGEVYGRLLNQFSLDEYNGNLRLATTVDAWVKQRVEYSNVYVLDENMKQVGELTDLAKDEQIYAARFLGNRLYLVTFQQVDPFFVIDLSDASNPKVLGSLKIPGFSDYLHPYDENHIIGIGKETGESDWGGVITKGIKIALFDVTDVSNPKEISKIEIGDSGSDSPALHDHKAFLFSKEKNLLVLPVSEITKRDRPNPYTYSYSVWNGAYVFHLDENGFKELGKVEHSSSKRDYFNWYDDTSVMRSLYMDNNLYTISNKYIKINDLSNNLENLNTVKLPAQDVNNYPTPVPMVGTAVASPGVMVK